MKKKENYLMKKNVLIVGMLLLTASPAFSAQRLTVMLDWFPNIDHLPLYVAQQEGLFSRAGLEVAIMSPSESTDALKLAASHKVDIAVSYEPQAIVAASRGLPVVVVGRLVEHPLGVILFLGNKGIRKPADLEGKRLGYTVPGMMDVLLGAFASINGIRHYTPVNVGFSIIPSLVSGKVDAVMGPYKNYEAIELREKGYAARYFEPCRWGIPDYDELVLISSKKAMKEKPAAVRAFVGAVGQAIDRTRKNPDKALKTYFKAVPEADRGLETKAFKVTLPLYASSQVHDAARWQAFADFALKYGLIGKRVDVRPLLGQN